MDKRIMPTSIDDLIINIVRENSFIYDKKSVNFKNAQKKKDLWNATSLQIKSYFNVDMSEKRWSALRDMFVRKNRKKKKIPSGSGYTETKEWHFYKSLLFLSPFVAHRQTHGSLVVKPAQCSGFQQTDAATELINSQDLVDEELLTPNAWEHSYYKDDLVQAHLEPISGTNTPPSSVGSTSSGSFSRSNRSSNESIEVCSDTIMRPCSVTSNNSDCSVFQNSPTPVHSKPSLASFKPVTTKVVPNLDGFAKRKRIRDEKLDENLAQASEALSNAVGVVSSMIAKPRVERDSFMPAVEEALTRVPKKCRTQCLIEILRVISNYEQVESD